MGELRCKATFVVRDLSRLARCKFYRSAGFISVWGAVFQGQVVFRFACALPLERRQ